MTQTMRPIVAAASAGGVVAPGDQHEQSRGFGVPARQASGMIRQLGGFLVWIFSGFGLLHLLRRRKGLHYKLQEVTFYSVHRAFFLWAMILLGFVASWTVRHWPQAAGAMGWLYICVVVYTFLTLLFDINAARFLLWMGIFGFVWLASRYLEDLKNVAMLSAVSAYLRHLQPRLDPGFASIVSWLLLLPWIGALFHTFTNGRKKITPNEIGEVFFGDGTELTDRSGLKFRTRYRDLLETLLGFGAGDLVAMDANHNVVKRWENILFLMFVWGRLDEVLHQRSAVVDNAPEDPVEVEDAARN